MAIKAANLTSRPSRRPTNLRPAEGLQHPTAEAAPGEPDALRILVTSHSHPKLTKGGAEISAYSLYQDLQAQPNIKAWFLGCSSHRIQTRLGSCISQPFGASEFVYDPIAEFEYFKFANRDPEFPKALESLITDIAPDIVHAHHYAIFGVESFWQIKRIRPQTKIVLTCHEYLAICLNHGQMVKAKTNKLCNSESFIDCHACFQDISIPDFFLRKSYFLKFFEAVDMFIAPSRFLAQRYIAWGLPEAKMSVVENIMPRVEGNVTTLRQPRDLHEGKSTKRTLRVGFFGQMSTLKGIKVLIEAAKTLRERKIQDIVFDIHGDYSSQPPDFQAELLKALEGEDASTNFRLHGSYNNEEVHSLMQTVDVVVMPSIWWENSPVVIQEAVQNRRPVICSDIGGMAEKVRPGLDGLHFKAGDVVSLVETLEYLLENPDVLVRLRETIREPTSAEETLRQHIQLYTTLLPSRVAA
jgi:glycosyltransferase involved in cell wall biosynthesis